MLFGVNAYSRVCNCQKGVAAVHSCGDGNAAARTIVFHGIVHKIAEYLCDEGPVALYARLGACAGKRYVRLTGHAAKTVCRFPGGLGKVNFRLGNRPLPQTGKTQYVCNERRHALSVPVYLSGKTRHFFLRHKAPRHELGSAYDGLQRRLQFVGNIGREYASKIMQAGISEEDTALLNACTAAAGELERIADKGLRMLDFLNYKKRHGASFSPLAQQELRELYADARQTLDMAVNFLDDLPVEDIAWITELSAKVRADEAELRVHHLEHLSRGECAASSGLVFIDTIGAIEQISYRARRLAEAMNSCRG